VTALWTIHIAAARAAVCDGERPAESVIELSEALNDVARELSRGGQLNDALDRLGFPIEASESLYLKATTDDAAVREIIADRYCAAVSTAPLTEVGVYRRGNETWIVLAARAEQPAVENSAAIAARVLELVNAARAEARRCGRDKLASAAPLALSQPLTEAASRHASDMARTGSFDHRGSDNTTPSERVSSAGYRWRATGENIAAGQSSADAVVDAWLDSPGHCTNLMGPQFTEMGVAFALAPSRSPAIYWAQVFAAPQ
jgi:uncharacterized protein YkwD